MRETFPVLVIQSNSLFREGLCRILRAARFRIVLSGPSIDPTSLDSVADRVALLVIVPGIDFRADLAQIELFKEKCPMGRVAVLAEAYRPSEVMAAFRSGANAYFLQNETCETLLRSLELVIRGQTFIPAEMLASVVVHENKAQGIDPTPSEAPILGARNLSAREDRILRYLIDGASNKIIARKLDIAEATVKVHVKAILRKLNVRNRTQAAIRAMNRASTDVGFLKPDAIAAHRERDNGI